MDLRTKLKNLREQGGCLLATNFYNFETLRGIVTAASEQRQPLILQLTKSSIDYMGLSMAVKMAREALENFQVRGWIHLDHADSHTLIHRCLDAGFDSVMVDASERPLEENIAITKEVVKLAEKYNANVEAELGYIAKLGQTQEKKAFTESHEARRFSEATGINALAVAIGSQHGFYKNEPQLDLERLREIQAATSIPLVLHGGSGIPEKSLREAVHRGICKINLATEIKSIFMQTLRENLSHHHEIDLRKAFPPATKAVTDLVKHKLEVVGHL